MTLYVYVYQNNIDNIVIPIHLGKCGRLKDGTLIQLISVQPDHIFLRDFVLFKHPIAGCTIGQIESFFDVSYMYHDI